MPSGAGQTISIIGGGLVGTLATLLLANRGHKVKLYEKRHDIRTLNLYEGRSINLALSERGLAALRKVGLEDAVKNDGIPMYARLIHKKDGTVESQPYGLYGEYIMSVDRRRLNETLLSAAEKSSNVEVFFDHQLSSLDLDHKVAYFEDSNHGKVEASSDVFIGTDGVFSVVRRSVMKKTHMDYQQEYITHGYKELCIPANPDGSFKLSNKHLHIWPRLTFMMIALPNKDATFTVTLFMPYDNFDAIQNEEQLLKFFQTNFPEAVDLIGKDRLIQDFFTNPTGFLMCVKCKPYNYKGTAVFMGDAAHAMCPFFGQGMNAGFQDVLVLDELLNQFNDDFDLALPAYSEKRHPDAVAICDLAMNNYVEMRAKVVSPWFKLQKRTEKFLHYLMPKTIIPLYTMVSFTDIPYSEAMARNKRQIKLVNWTLSFFSAAATAAAAAGVFTLLRHYKQNQ